MNPHSFIRQTVEQSDREEHARRVKKPVLPPGPEGTEGSRALAGERRVTEQGEGDTLHRDLYYEWQDKKEHYESLSDDSPQKDGAGMNASYAQKAWEKAVLESAEYALRRG